MIWESVSYEDGVPGSSRRDLSYYGEKDPYDLGDDDENEDEEYDDEDEEDDEFGDDEEDDDDYDDDDDDSEYYYYDYGLDNYCDTASNNS